MVGNRLLLVCYCLLHSVINDFLNTNFLNKSRTYYRTKQFQQLTSLKLIGSARTNANPVISSLTKKAQHYKRFES